MADELGVSTTDLQWVISGYMLALGAFLIPGGRLGDILGRRRTLIYGLAIFAGASTVCGLVDSAELVIGFRIVQGIGAAIIFPLCVAVVTNAYPAERRKRAIGNLYGLAAVAVAVGPFFGGFFTEEMSWRAVFLVNVPLGRGRDRGRAAGDPRVARRDRAAADRLRRPRRGRDRDRGDHVRRRRAAGTRAGARPGSWSRSSAASAVLAAFVAIEARVPFPLIDLSLFRNLPYVVVTLLGMIGNTAFVITTFTSAIYLQQVRDLSPIEAGAVYLAASVTTAIAGPLSGRLGERFDIPRLMAVSMLIGATALLLISLDTGLCGLRAPAPGLRPRLRPLLVPGVGRHPDGRADREGRRGLGGDAGDRDRGGRALGGDRHRDHRGAGRRRAPVQAEAIESIWRVAAIGSAVLGVALGVLGGVVRSPPR